MTIRQTLRARMIDVFDPRLEDVDFREIAEELSTINRYTGAAVKPVSVAAHTLIACDATSSDARPYVLLHDAHETRLGDFPRPAFEAFCKLGAARFGAEGETVIRSTWRELVDRHDKIIWAAAGLREPSAAMKAEIHRADNVALVTEQRDFLEATRKPWPGLESYQPLPRVYRLRAPLDVAAELYQRFETYLPALRGRAA